MRDNLLPVELGSKCHCGSPELTPDILYWLWSFLLIVMDKFVTFVPVSGKRRAAEPLEARPEMVQLQITDLRKVSSIDAIKRFAAALRRSTEEGSAPETVLPVLDQLKKCFVSVEILESTGIGQLVFRLTRHGDATVAAASTALYSVWREDAKQAVRRRQKLLKQATPGKARAGAAASEISGSLASSSFILQEVNIEREMAEWDDASARGARLVRPALQAGGGDTPDPRAADIAVEASVSAASES